MSLAIARRLAGPGPRPIPIWPLLAAGVAFRFWYASFRQLVPDEAFYWALSRHLQPGYLDHPPMLMALIHLSTLAMGSTEVGVRFVSIAMGFATLSLLLRLADYLFHDTRTKLYLLLMWLASPLFHGLAGIVTPDTPSIFFSLCALGFALVIAERIELFGGPSPSRPAPDTTLPWMAFGLFCGLALMSKYTTVLLPVSVFFAILSHPRGRRELLRPWPYVAALAGLAVFWPVIHWNATHGWVSFKYQLGHGLSIKPKAVDLKNAADPLKNDAHSIKASAEHLKTFCEYIGLQILFFTPVFFVLGMVVLTGLWRQFRSVSLSRRMLLWAATVPLVFFAVAATRSKGEGNWPAFGYFPASLLMAEYLMQRNWTGSAMKWAKTGCIVAVGITIVMHSPELLYNTHIVRPLPRKLVDMFGWRELGHEISRVRGTATRGGMPVVCNTHEDAGEVAFYTPGQPDVWCVSLGQNSRPTAFDYLPDGPQLDKVSAVLLVGGNQDEFCRRFGLDPIMKTRWTIFPFGHERNRTLDLCARPIVGHQDSK